FPYTTLFRSHGEISRLQRGRLAEPQPGADKQSHQRAPVRAQYLPDAVELGVREDDHLLPLRLTDAGLAARVGGDVAQLDLPFHGGVQQAVAVADGLGRRGLRGSPLVDRVLSERVDR